MLIHFNREKDIATLSEEKLIPFVSELFFNTFLEEVGKKGFFAIALAGGSTPKKLYEYIAKHPLANKVPHDKIHLFWGDERAVPPTHPDSNFKMALDAGFGSWKIPEKNIHRMKAESDIEINATAYQSEIETLLGNKGFDMVLLGMGDDGHTASLFPNTHALNENKKLVVPNFVEQKNTWRMTLTYPMINKSKNIIFMVTGSSKEKMIEQIFSKEGSNYPCYRVGTSANKALWVLDTEAAKKLTFEKK